MKTASRRTASSSGTRSSLRIIAACATRTASFRPTTNRRAGCGATMAATRSSAPAKTGATLIAARTSHMSDIAAETTTPRTPWGLWATLGWVILAFVLSVVAGLVVLLIWRPDAIMGGGADMLKDGPLISITTIASAAVQVGMLALAARLARWPAGEYLGLLRPATRPALITIAILVVFLLGYDGLTYLLGRAIVTPFQVDTYRTARDSGSLPLLWLTFVIVAPVAEEIM